MPVQEKKYGGIRKVGFELEFTGLSLEDALASVQSSLGGKLQPGTMAERTVTVEPLGDFVVEIDWSRLKRMAAKQSKEHEESKWVDFLSTAAPLLVPIEVVCPPIPADCLHQLHPMTNALRAAGARGTGDSPFDAFGVHINTEVPSLDATVLASYLRSYALLQWWLVEAHEVDLTRKITPYVDLYTEGFIERILSWKEVALDEVFDDYLKYNPTRNRALDLLPLLAEIDEKRVRAAVDDPRIKPRPTFHYRMPNCEIEKQDWSLAYPFNIWWIVEYLAGEPEDLEYLSAAYLDSRIPVLGVNRADWVKFIDQWLKDRGLA